MMETCELMIAYNAIQKSHSSAQIWNCLKNKYVQNCEQIKYNEIAQSLPKNENENEEEYNIEWQY